MINFFAVAEVKLPEKAETFSSYFSDDSPIAE